MSQVVHVLGIDAGFAAIGVAVIDLGSDTVTWAGAFRTAPAVKKLGLRVADSDAARCQEIARFLRHVVAEHEVCGAVVELPHAGAQGARANRSMGMATAIVAVAMELLQLPTEWVTPTDVKMVAGKRTATKGEVQEAVARALTWETDLADLAAWEREHVADAAAAVQASRNSTLLRVLVANARAGYRPAN